ncbi:MAG: hypothetical protein HC920_11230 [Oscillatoriales cyanobacterium SM2_3_0]|nr:hypothetical protein [Oscillatoriales cyanobacterium SM2_3_0]
MGPWSTSGGAPLKCSEFTEQYGTTLLVGSGDCNAGVSSWLEGEKMS